MMYKVVMIAAIGLGNFATRKVEECDPVEVHPVPAPLFETPEAAEKWADEMYPTFVANERYRLRDLEGGDVKPGSKLGEYVRFLADEHQRILQIAASQETLNV